MPAGGTARARTVDALRAGGVVAAEDEADDLLAVRVLRVISPSDAVTCGFVVEVMGLEPTTSTLRRNPGPPLLRQLKKVDNLNDFVTRLRSRRYPGLAITSTVFDAEYHLTAPAASLGRGLPAIFDEERP